MPNRSPVTGRPKITYRKLRGKRRKVKVFKRNGKEKIRILRKRRS